MSSKHIKVQFIEAPTDSLTPEECLALADRAEALLHLEWRDLWLEQAVIEERRLRTDGQLEIGV